MSFLVSIWLQLTGGESGCPRLRFALTMLASYALYHLVLPRFVHCLVGIEASGLPEDLPLLRSALIILGMVMAAISLLLAFLPLSPVALLDSGHALRDTYRLLQGKGVSLDGVQAEAWLYWLGFGLGALALLFAGSVAFGAAWRRLKDCGRSPLFLLLGLTYLLGFNADGSYAAESAGVYLLGPLWLIILFSQPGKPRADFSIFRPLP